MPHLLASVGILNYQESIYRYKDRQCRTRFAPVAVARLRGDGGGRASILVTPESRQKWFAALAEELADAGFETEAVDVPECRNEDQILETFLALAERIQEGEEIILDVTLAFRHLPFVYLAALAYLVALKGVQVKGIYYGAHMMGENGETPLLDVTPLFDLMEWYRALGVANETGDFRPVAALLRKDSSLRFKQGRGEHGLSKAVTAANKLAAALASGLPLEVGYYAHSLYRAVEVLDTQSASTISSALALERLGHIVQPWAVPVEKAELQLCCRELERQLLLAEWYIDQMNIHTALLVLREWMVNAVLLARGVTMGWLDYGKHRKPVELFLNALHDRNRDGLVSETEKEFAELWSAVSEKRNEFAHAGMKETAIPLDRNKIQTLLQRCRYIFDLWAVPSSRNCTGGRVLVSPLGLSPGSLFSALHHVCPDRVLVITSAEASQFIPEILRKAGRPDLQPDVVTIRDPHQGFDEAKRILDGRDELRKQLVLAAEVVVNITGGTTALQYAAESIGQRVRQFGTAVRRVALVDRRDIFEQRQNPYVIGDLVNLDD